MTFSELRLLIGETLEQRLAPLQIPALGLYYDTVSDSHERLYVRYWFPFSGLYRGAYNEQLHIDRLLLQIDVKHFPAAGSVQTPPPTPSETVWEAAQLDRLPGTAGLKRQLDCRPPVADPNDHSRWGWHRFLVYSA